MGDDHSSSFFDSVSPQFLTDRSIGNTARKRARILEDFTPGDIRVRLLSLLKPPCQRRGANGRRHSYGTGAQGSARNTPIRGQRSSEQPGLGQPVSARVWVDGSRSAIISSGIYTEDQQ